MGGGPPADAPMVDTSEQVYISSLALLKMLKHGKYQHKCSSACFLLFLQTKFHCFHKEILD